MKITLTNFLCYDSKIFSVNDKELTLIEGPSGKGKSTIIKSILFALFGVGTKLPTYGKTSCKVVLEFEDIKIERTKKPNTLKVNDSFEDQAAQELINRKFGEFFVTSSYIAQNALSSFIVQSPADKMTFLETFAFKGENIDELKQKNNKLIKKYNEDSLKLESKIDILQGQLDTKVLPDKVKFPVKCKRSEVPKITLEYKEKVGEYNTVITKLTDELEIIKDNISELKLYNNNLDNYNKRISELSEKLDVFEDKLLNSDYEGDNALSNLEKQHKNILLNETRINLEKKYNELEAKYKKYKKDDERENKAKIDKIKSKLWVEYEKEAIDEMIEDHEELLKDRRKLDSLIERQNTCVFGDQDELEADKTNLSEELENYNRINENYNRCKNVLTCPTCDSKLKLVENDLVKFTDKIELEHIDTKKINSTKLKLDKISDKLAVEKNNEAEYNKYECKINKIKEKYEEIPEYKSIQDDYLYLKKYKDEQLLLEEQLANIKESSHLKELHNELLELQTKIDKIPESSVKSNLDKDSIYKLICEQKSLKEEYKFINDEIMNYNTIIDEQNTEKDQIISDYESKYTETNILTLTSKLDDHKVNLQNNKNKLDETVSINKTIEDWHNYQTQKEEYDALNNSIKNLSKEKIECENKYNASLKFKNIILSCEAAIMHDIINTINLTAKTYLDIFFQDDPINVNLSSFKENKKGIIVPTINVETEYKGMECELSMLSGGELSRVILAFTLALNELFNSPLILLDESTASLDQESTNIVFEAIKNNCISKTVIIIAHQVVNGGFDNIISLY